MNRPRALRRPLAAGVVLCLFALFAPTARAADAPAPPQKGVSIEGITEYRLDNGLRILLFPDASTPNVTVNLTVLVGSRHEGYGETGMAHLLEHMVFKGTPMHPDVPKALRDHGARFNGTTWVDRTNYFETMDGTDANLEFAIRLEADRLVNSYVKREDLLSEMTVVRNEFEMGENNPDSILGQRMLAVAYEWHNYGKSTIGNRSDIERVPIDNLQAFYRKYYQPDNCILIIAGKFDEKKALDCVTKYFGALKKPARKLDATYTEEPAQDGERTVVLRRVGKVGVVGAVYHIPAGAHPDYAAVEVLEELLTSEPSGRLYKALVASKKASSVRGVAFSWHDPAVMQIVAQVDKGQSLEAVRDTMLDVLEKLSDSPPTAEEVGRAKAKLTRDRELLMTNSNRIGTVLSEWAAMGDWRLFFLHRDRLAKVTPEDVARVGRQYLVRTNRTVGLYIPMDVAERAKVPETPDVAKLLQDYKGGQAVAAGEAFDPTPDNIEARVRRSELPGGVKVALLPRKSRGEAVVVDLNLRYGNEESLKGLTVAANFLPRLLGRGTKQHTYQQIQDELARLKARLSVSGQPGLINVSVQCKRQDLPAVLALVREILRAPTLPQDEFDVLKRQEKERLEKGLAEPTALAFISIQRKLSPYPKDDVRYIPTIAEHIALVEGTALDQVRKLYAEQLGGQHGELAVVGDFDPDAVVPLAAELVKEWKAATPYRRIPRPAQLDVAGGKEVIETPDKANAIYVAGHTLALTDTDPDYPALAVADFILGNAPLATRLGNRVRQKEGLSYGVRSQLAAHPIDKMGTFLMMAICNPDNMPKVDVAMAEEVQRLLKDGVEAKELEEAKKAWLQQYKGQRSSDSQLASLLAGGMFLGRTFAYQADVEKRVAALTPEMVNAAVRKHLDGKRLIIIHAGDFQKKAGAK